MSTPATRQEARRKSNARPEHGPLVTHGPGPRAVQKAVSFGPSLARLVKQLSPDAIKLVLVVCFGIASVSAGVVGPRILGRATDVIFEGVMGRPGGIDLDRLWRILTVAGLLYVGSSLLLFGQNALLNRVVQHAVYRMREQVRAKLDRLPLSFFDTQPRGELLSRVTNDIDNISQTMQQTFSQLLNSLLMIIGVTVMMFQVSPTLAAITLMIIPISGILSAFVGKRAQTRFTRMWAATGELNGQIEEAFTGHALVKVFGRRVEVGARFNQTNDKLFDAAFGAQFISGLIMPLNGFLGNLNYVVIAVIGGIRVANGTMPLGNVTAFIQYSRMFTQPISQVASMANLLQSGVASAERVFEVLDADEQTPDRDGRLPEPVRGHVEFDNVTFSYDPEHPLIANLNLVAQPGQTVAIVGPTGAGKTTLVNLLERFYEVNGGTIRLDGVDIATVPRQLLRSQFGMVLQDTWLFGGTIRDNIAYGQPGSTDEDVLAAATAAYVDRFVHALPNGYDTVLDDDGSTLSAGEKQLVTIARAFIADPVVLILDEATSSVDTRTEVLVQNAMAALRSNRTSFVIAHRLSTIRDADLILVMNEGAIVESGSHDELISRPGPYLDLYNSQFASAFTG